MAIKETEKKKYDVEELMRFSDSLNRFYSILEVEIEGNMVEVECLDLATVRDTFVKSKPEVGPVRRLETFENLYSQWREWKFAEFFRQEEERKKRAHMDHLQH